MSFEVDSPKDSKLMRPVRSMELSKVKSAKPQIRTAVVRPTSAEGV